jgi:hypothetical protein
VFQFGNVRRTEVVENRFDHGAFQCADNFKNVFDILNRQFVDQNAASGQNGDKPYALEPDDRIPQGSRADPQSLADLLEVYAGARKAFATGNLLPDVLINLLS